jgi:hypothetical protein
MTKTEEKFRSIGIDRFVPGFYDDPAFLEAEKRNPYLLEDYAHYVDEIEYSQQYLDDARKTIKSAAAFLNARLVKDGRKGACIDASGILGRFLEKAGIWNYAVKGGLTIDFAKHTRLSTIYFAPVFEDPNPEGGGMRAGHSWLVAPPFQIVDITLRQQPFRKGQGEYLPAMLLADQSSPGRRDIFDWIDPDLLGKLVRDNGRMITLRDLVYLLGPHAVEAAERLGVRVVATQHATLKYGSTGIMAGDCPLEKARNLVLSGVTPIEMYEQWQSEVAAVSE